MGQASEEPEGLGTIYGEGRTDQGWRGAEGVEAGWPLTSPAALSPGGALALVSVSVETQPYLPADSMFSCPLWACVDPVDTACCLPLL